MSPPSKPRPNVSRRVLNKPYVHLTPESYQSNTGECACVDFEWGGNRCQGEGEVEIGAEARRGFPESGSGAITTRSLSILELKSIPRSKYMIPVS